MRWQDKRRSSNVEDRRSGGGGLKRAGLPMGIGGLVIVVAIVLLGGDPMPLLEAMSEGSGGSAGGPEASTGGSTNPEEDRLADLVSVVLADTEDVWTKLFAAQGATYPAPTLVLFTGSVSSRCGMQSAAVGPFYCPGDRQVYMDLGFFEQLSSRFGAPGDFAQAYVVAHEVGHHIQTLTGLSSELAKLKQGRSEAEQNALSVRQELQADCYAGVWGHHAATDRQLLEEGDVEEGLRAAAAIGDDTLQKAARGSVAPESFTHGSARQRQEWLLKGLRTGDMGACDTSAG